MGGGAAQPGPVAARTGRTSTTAAGKVTTIMNEKAQPVTAAGPKYLIDIEGTKYPWDRDTITVPEIRSLGNLPPDLPVIEVDLRTGTERTLAEDEIVEIRPGQGFSKKVSFKRGAE